MSGSSDFLARYGGGEVVIMLAGIDLAQTEAKST
jgi:hypothetical protein